MRIPRIITILLMGILLILVACSSTQSLGPSETPGPKGTPGPTETPGPKGTPGPTETPGPKGTPDPTETPGPTVTPGPTGISEQAAVNALHKLICVASRDHLRRAAKLGQAKYSIKYNKYSKITFKYH